jgi:hypothetical protein
MKAYDVKTLRPCRSGGIIVEGHFGREFAMHDLCLSLQGVAKCSVKLGVARFPTKGVTSLSIEMDELTCTGLLLKKRQLNLSTT